VPSLVRSIVSVDPTSLKRRPVSVERLSSGSGGQVALSRICVYWKFGFFAIVLVVMMADAPVAAAAGLSLTPSEGTPGSSFVVTGSGFEPGRNVKVRWDGSGFPGVVTVDDSGTFSVKLTVPGDASRGNHVVSAAETGRGQEAKARFSVVAPPASTTTSATTTTPPTTTAPTTTSPTTTSLAPTTTRAPGTATSASTSAPSAELEATVSTDPAEDPIGGGEDDDPGAGTASTPSPATVEASEGFGELRVSPDEATSGQAVVATFSSTELIDGEVWLQLNGSDVTPSRFVTDSEPEIFRFRVPDDLEPGTYRLAAVTVEDESLRELAATDMSVSEAGGGGFLPWAALLLALLILGGSTWGWFVLARPRNREADESDGVGAEADPVGAVPEKTSKVALVATSGGWTRRIFDVGQPAVSIDDVEVFSDQLWAVGASPQGLSTSAIVWSSADGSNWEQVADLGPGKATSLDTWGRQLIITGTHPSRSDHARWEWGVWASDDGDAWRSLIAQAEPQPRGAPLGAASVGEALIVYGRSREQPQVWRASSGSSLKRVTVPGPVDFVAPTSEGFIAFGKDDMGLPTVMVSARGEHWTPMKLPPHSPLSESSIRAFAEFGDSMIAAGFGVTSDQAAVCVSDDGEHWDPLPFASERGTSITHLTAFDDRLVAIGSTRQFTDSRVMTSIAAWMTADGLDWERLGDGALLADATPSAVSAMDEHFLIAGRLFTAHGPEDPGTSTVWFYDPSRDVPDGTSEADLGAAPHAASQPHRFVPGALARSRKNNRELSTPTS
jgi:hypothetical protein